MPAPSRPDLHAKVALAGILLLAFFLRMGQPTLVEFKLDESGVVRRAQAIAYEGDLPALGAQASVGPAHFPLMLYLAALPLRLWNDPVAAVLFVGLLNGLAVWACYAFGRAHFGTGVGLIAALLFAVNPWAVVYARKLWSQNLPLANLGFFASLFAVFVSRKRWALVPAVVCLAILIGLHLGGLIFAVVLGVAVVIYHDAVDWKYLGLGVAVLLLLLSPYLIWDAQHGWQNVSRFLGYAGGSGKFSWDALYYAFALTGSRGLEGMAGPFHATFKAAAGDLWWGNGVVSVLLALALLYALLRALRGERANRRRFTLLLLWFWTPVLSQVRSSTPTQAHYFLLLYPVQFLLIAVLSVEVLKRLSRPVVTLRKRSFSAAALGLGVVLLVWCGWQLNVTAHLRAMMVQHPLTGGYGIPLRYTRAAAQRARKAAGSLGEVLVLSDVTRPFLDEMPTVFDALLFGQAHRFARADEALPVPEGRPVVYLMGPLQDDAQEYSPLLRRMESLAEPGPQVHLSGGWSYRTYLRAELDRADVVAGMEPLEAGIPFANGVVFAAAELPDTGVAGKSLGVWLAWWVQGLPPEGVDYHFTVQLLGADGALLSQVDQAAFPSDTWQVNDLVLSYFALPLAGDVPAGVYTVRAGMYSFPDVVPVPVLDHAQQIVDDSVTLGRVTVTGKSAK